MQTHALYLAKHLHARGYPIEVVTLQTARPHVGADVAKIDDALDFPVHRVLSRLGYFHNFEIIERLARAFGPDLIYCSTIFYGDLGRRLGVPVVSRSVGNDVMRPWIAYPYALGSALAGDPRIEEPLHRFFRRFEYPEYLEMMWHRRRRALMVHGARAQTHVLANSSFTRELLLEVGLAPERVSELVGGVEYARFARPAPLDLDLRARYDIPPERFLMLTACRMVKKKGVDFLVDAMPKLVEQHPDVHLVLVGDGRHYRRFRRAARRSPATDHITFTGRISHDEIHPFYLEADAFVLASRVEHEPRTGRRDAETMGRVLCEANAAGLPVLAARSGGIPSVIKDGDNGLLFEPDDVDTLLDALTRLRQTPGLRAELRARGRERARDQFDWSVILDAHERCFARILSPRGTSDVQVPPRPDRAPLPSQVRVVFDAQEEPDISSAS